jgi:hypothetical protein
MRWVRRVALYGNQGMYYQVFTGLSIWSALSEERTSLSFNAVKLIRTHLQFYI